LDQLQRIPNFPKIEFSYDDLYENPDYMKQLVDLIREVFEITAKLYGNLPNYIQKNRKLLVKRLTGKGQGRSLSAPPVLFRNILSSTILPISKIRKISSQRTIPDQRQQDSEEQYYRRMSITQQRREEDPNNANRRKISPEPMIRSNVPKPLFPSASTTGIRNNHNNRSYMEEEDDHGIRSSYAKPGRHRGRSVISGMDPRRIGEKGIGTGIGGGRSRSFSPSLLNRNHSQQPRVRIKTPEKQRKSNKNGKLNRSSSPSSPSASFLSSSHLSIATKPLSKLTVNQSNHSYSNDISKRVTIRQMEMLRERIKAQQSDRNIRRKSFLTKYEEEKELKRRQQQQSKVPVPTSPLPSSPSKRKVKKPTENITDSIDLNPRSESNGRNGLKNKLGRIVDVDRQTGALIRQSAPTLGDYEEQEQLQKPAPSSSVTALRSRYQKQQQQPQQHLVSSISSFSALRQYGDWSPPPPDPIEVEKASKLTSSLPSITQAQQTTIRDWLLSLGISVLDGEGGYYSNDDNRKEGNSSLSSLISTNIVPLSLSKDRLRNGETFCLLFCYLESVASYHCNLFRAIHRNPRTLGQAKSNFEKVLWLFRMKASPPLSLVYLYQPSEEFIKCNKNVIWGLLWEIMQVYSSSSSGEGGRERKAADLGYNSSQFFGNLHPQPINTAYYRPSHHPTPASSLPSFPSSHVFQYDLPYSPVQRRSLDISLLDWFSSKGILQLILGNLSRPPTILALETYIKDGTLLCVLCEKVLYLSFFSSFGYDKHPHTYSQCLSNIGKVVKLLKGCKAMSSRFLYQGIEEDIARGKWDSILGLLEDMHFLSDSIEQHQLFPHRRSSAPYPDDNKDSGNKDGMIGGIHVTSIPPFVASWNMIDRPYLGLSSVKRNQLHSSTVDNPLLYPHQQHQGGEEGSGREGEKKDYALLRNAIFNGSNKNHNCVNDTNYDNNHVRLDRYYPSSQDEVSQLQKKKPLIESSAATMNSDNQRFRPSLDLRHSFPVGEIKRNVVETEVEEEDDDDNDVSFLFSPTKEEENEEPRRSIDLLPKPTTTTEGFQNGLLHKHHQSRSISPPDYQKSHPLTAGSSMTFTNSFPSIKEMTANDPALSSLEEQRHERNPFSPGPKYSPEDSNNVTSSVVDASPSSIAQDSLSPKETNNSHINSSTKKKSPSNGRRRDISPSPMKPTNGILLSLQQVIEWIFSLGIKLTFDRKHLKEISLSSSSASLAIDKILISPSLLKDFGRLFNDGIILAQIVKKLTHQEINGLFYPKEMKSEPQQLTSLTQAQRRYNIRKSLELLTMNNKKIPLRQLSCEEDILYGDSVTIIELLEKIKKAYYFVT
jgi:hypothetical protein